MSTVGTGEVSRMEAWIYEPDGITGVQVVYAPGLLELKRKMSEHKRPGRIAVVMSGQRARKADIYIVARYRNQWLRGRRVDRPVDVEAEAKFQGE